MTRRNSNGDGSIYQGKDKRWVGAFYAITTNGTRKRKYVYGKTRTEARAKLNKEMAAQRQGILTAEKSWKLGEFLDYWLEHLVKPSRRPGTYELYEANVRLYLKPGLGHYKLEQLSVPLVQSYLNSHINAHKTIRKSQALREILSSALTSAMRHELLSRNVARLVELPGRSPSKVEPWNLSEANRFLEKTKDHWFHAAFVLLLTYGLRRGEVLGLRWSDLDLINNEIRIEQQVYRANGIVGEGPLKTAASRRKLPLVSIARDILEIQRARPAGTVTHLVFTSPKNGGMVNPPGFTRAFQRACEAAGLRVVGPHTMRHTTATILKDLGVPARDAQLILGHSNIVTTQQIYQHGDLVTRREAIERLEQNFGHDSSTDSVQESTLLSKQLSAGAGSLDEKQEKTPNRRPDLYKFLGDLTGNRTPITRMRTRNSHTMGERITEVGKAVQVRRRTWFLGVVAVNLAVKDEEQEVHQQAA